MNILTIKNQQSITKINIDFIVAITIQRDLSFMCIDVVSGSYTIRDSAEIQRLMTDLSKFGIHFD